MPVYKYKGMNDAGKAVNGIRNADNPRALRSLLRKENIFLTDVEQRKIARVAARATFPPGAARSPPWNCRCSRDSFLRCLQPA